MSEAIRKDLPVFLHDGDVAIGAVRGMSGGDLVIYIENAGEVQAMVIARRTIDEYIGAKN